MDGPCEVLRTEMGELFECSPLGDYTKVRTPFLYPDGDRIDLYLKEKDGGVTLTDLGETMRWLHMQTTALRRSPKQKQIIDDICMNHGVEFYKGMLTVRVPPDQPFSSVLTRLAQASLRVADVWFTFRTRAVESVTDEVNDYLCEKEIPLQRSERFSGRSGRIWTVDFHTRLPRQTSFVFVLSTGSRAAARGIAEHVVAACHDMSHYKVGQEFAEFVSLVDDTLDVWSDEDFRLVGDLSRVAHWSKPEEFLETIGYAA